MLYHLQQRMSLWHHGGTLPLSNTTRTFNTKWNQYCVDKNIDVFQPGVTNGIEFLVSLYKLVLGYSAINTARSALSSILVLEDGVKSGEQMNEGVVSKETVVLRRWGSSIQKFGFINGVDNVNWPPYRDSKS